MFASFPWMLPKRRGTNWSSQNMEAGVIPILSSLCRRLKGTSKVAVQRNGHFRYKLFGDLGAFALLTHHVPSGHAEHTEGGAE